MNYLSKISVTGSFLFCLSIASLPATAQVTTDGTTSTTVNTNGNNFEINDGDRAGGNLFHSFRDFSVRNGGEAFFNNANDIVNIFSRVTGGGISNIDGLLRANGGANLFLINPAGIIFGNNARLDIGGSFYGTSADSILFEDGEFSATDLDNPPLLTINAPIGLNFRDNPGDITVNNNGMGLRRGEDPIIPSDLENEQALRVSSDSTLGLIGGNLTFNGATLRTAGGRIELGSVGSNQQVGLTQIENGWQVDYAGVNNFGNIQLNGASAIDASGDAGGNIRVAGNDITLIDGSQIEASTLGSGTGGNLEVTATGTLELREALQIENSIFRSGLFTNVNQAAIGTTGDIKIEASNLTLSDGGVISVETKGIGNAGNIIVNSNLIEIDGFNSATGNISTIENFVATDAIGNGGNIDIQADSLSLTNGGGISAATLGEGNAGNIDLDIAETLTLDGAIQIEQNLSVSGIFSNVESGAVGNGGIIALRANNLSLTNGAQIQTIVRGANEQLGLEAGNGIAGNIIIDVDELVSVDGVSDVFQVNGINNSFNSLISSSLNFGATGRSGNININAGALSLTNGGQILSSTFGNGDAGTITVDVDNDITLENSNVVFTGGIPIPAFSRISSNVELTNAIGNAGEINIAANNLFARNGGLINSSTFGQGNAGNINLDINELVSLDGITQVEQNLSVSGIASNVESGAIGNGGVINLQANNLSLTNGAQIQTLVRQGQTFNGQQFDPGNGIGGNIIIDVDELVSVDGVSEVFQVNGINNSFNSLISSSLNFGATGRSGNININAGALSLTNGGQISSDTFGNGDAGTITVDVDNDITLENGNLTFTTNGTPFPITSSIFSTVGLTNAIGNAGEINIAANNLFARNGGLINSSTFGQGNAGNINLDINELVSLDGITQVEQNLSVSGIASNVESGAIGNGGVINLQANNLSLTNGAQIQTLVRQGQTFNGQQFDPGNGIGGNIIIDVDELVSVDGVSEVFQVNGINNSFNSLISSSLNFGATGRSGNININAGTLSLSNGGRLLSSSFGQGNAGNIRILANNIDLIDRGSIEAENRSTITTEQTEQSDIDTIDLQVAEDITLDNNSFISARAFGEANGGNLNIDTRFIVAFPNGNNNIIANANQGNGGNITISAESLFGIEERELDNLTNDINASSEQGAQFDGNVAITTPEVDAIRGATELPTNVVEVQQTTAEACAANPDTGKPNGLTVKGKGGIIPPPDSPLSADVLNIGGKITAFSSPSVPLGKGEENAVSSHINPESAEIEPIRTSKGDIYPARGIIKTADGRVILTAYPTENIATRTPTPKPNCH
jgi:filamentous hemagglutinin family protein